MHVDEAVLAIGLRNSLRNVARQLVGVVFALAPPPESFRLGLHRVDDLLVAQGSVPLYVDPRYRETAPLVHAEGQLELTVHDGRVDLHGHQGVALGFIQRIDSSYGPRNLIGVDWPSNKKINTVTDRVDRQPVKPSDVHIAKDGTLFHVKCENRLSIRRDVARCRDIVELPRGKQVLDRALEYARAQGNTWRDAGVAAKHRLGDALIAVEHHAVRRCARPRNRDVAAGLL